MASGPAPRIDGLSIDFHWSDSFGILLFQNGFSFCLLSVRGAFSATQERRSGLTDHLCTDYNLSRALSNTLKDIQEIIVHTYPTYCVPDRTIMTIPFLIHDVIDECKYYNVKLGIVFLFCFFITREKLLTGWITCIVFFALRASCIADGFLAWVGLSYTVAHCMGKIGARLSQPIPVQWGKRQGCPLLVQLYSSAIEPLLCRLSRSMVSHCFGF